jgi:hypothetical protein
MKTRIAFALFTVCLIAPARSQTPIQQPSNTTYPQIVRIRYVEGDVRIARGKQNEKTTGAAWEEAAVNLPLESGFTLATGAGRAEVELEDSSTLYLAENSVLTLNDLYTADGVPHTELGLLTGTASFDLQSYIPGAKLIVETPTDTFSSGYPVRGPFRIDSYADAMAITPLEDGVLRQAGTPQQAMAKGQTQITRRGARIKAPAGYDAAAFAAWDKWVAERIARESAAMAEVMKASGLSEPIPGLAEMEGQGRFFECAPYGTCWEPLAFAADKPEQADGGGAESDALAEAQTQSRRASEMGYLLSFPCIPPAVRAMLMNAVLTDTDDSALVFGYPYDWAVCHAGSWIPRGHHYAWVVGHKRHHHEPVHWVKVGHRVGYVPIHPRDVKGQPPINGRHEFFAVSHKSGQPVERVKVDSGHPVEALASAPREYLDAELFFLARANEPHMEAIRIGAAFSGSSGAPGRAGGIPLSFDHKSQSFTMANQVVRSEKSGTVMQPASNRGGEVQARSGGSRGGVGGSSLGASSVGASRPGASRGAGSSSSGASGGGRSVGSGTVAGGSRGGSVASGGHSGGMSSSGGGGGGGGSHSSGGGGGFGGGGSSGGGGGHSGGGGGGGSSSSSSSSSAGSSGGGGHR